jgi:hypothetical protein
MTEENIAHLIQLFAAAFKLFKPDFVHNLEGVDGRTEQKTMSD